MYGFSEDSAKHIHDLLADNKDSVGVKYIGFGDERLLGNYPSVVVTSEPLDRTVHGTHHFEVILRCSIWVYHAKLGVGHKIRTLEDMQLAKEITKLIHTDFTLGGNVVFGHIDGETPGIVNRMIGGKSQAVVGTRLTWTGRSIQNFTEAQ